jgi:hypothetical protein
MLKALADGETNPAALAALADQHLRAMPEQLCDAFGACTDLKPVYRRLLQMVLEQLQILDRQIGQLDQEMAILLNQHQGAVKRLAEVPVWEWIQRNRSLLKPVPPQRPFLPRNVSPPGLVHAPVTTRARA